VRPRVTGAPRLAGLDILRAVAVLLVIFHHGIHDRTLVGWSDLGAGVARFLGRGGWIGVDLFFVLSGFLVSGLLFKEHQRTGSLSPVRFLVRRGFKIYPAFYALLAFTIGKALVEGLQLDQISWSNVAAEVFFFQNYTHGVLPHTWSLAVEEHFYILAAVTLALMARKGGRDPFRRLPVVFAAVAVFCLAARLLMTAAIPGYHAYVHLFPTHLRLDGLTFGVLLSYLFHFRRGWLDRLVAGREGLLAVAGLLLLLPAFLFPHGETPAIYSVGVTGFYVGSGLLVLALVMRPPAESLAVRAAAYVGRHSYSIYLWHMTVIVNVWRFTDGPGVTSPVHLAGFVALGLLVGVAAAKAVEMPALRVRDRLYPAEPAASKVRAVTLPLAVWPLLLEGDQALAALAESGLPTW
jgi:peptidoglycan/LPS O-acetylase OafA/YrhL